MGSRIEIDITSLQTNIMQAEWENDFETETDLFKHLAKEYGVTWGTIRNRIKQCNLRYKTRTSSDVKKAILAANFLQVECPQCGHSFHPKEIKRVTK